MEVYAGYPSLLFKFSRHSANNKQFCRAQTYGMMVISKSNREVECEFRHLSLAEYLSAVHIHTTGNHFFTLIVLGEGGGGCMLSHAAQK